jgi:hypothetical protein
MMYHARGTPNRLLLSAFRTASLIPRARKVRLYSPDAVFCCSYRICIPAVQAECATRYELVRLLSSYEPHAYAPAAGPRSITGDSNLYDPHRRFTAGRGAPPGVVRSHWAGSSHQPSSVHRPPRPPRRPPALHTYPLTAGRRRDRKLLPECAGWGVGVDVGGELRDL